MPLAQHHIFNKISAHLFYFDFMESTDRLEFCTPGLGTGVKKTWERYTENLCHINLEIKALSQISIITSRVRKASDDLEIQKSY